MTPLETLLPSESDGRGIFKIKRIHTLDYHTINHRKHQRFENLLEILRLEKSAYGAAFSLPVVGDPYPAPEQITFEII